jgi:hypothetical protein
MPYFTYNIARVAEDIPESTVLPAWGAINVSRPVESVDIELPLAVF